MFLLMNAAKSFELDFVESLICPAELMYQVWED